MKRGAIYGVLLTVIVGFFLLIFVAQISTGAPYDWITHNIDKLINFGRDRDIASNIHTQVASLVNLARISADLAYNLEQVAKDSKQSCIHRIDMFDHGIFEEYQLGITSTGMQTRVSLYSGNQEVHYNTIAQGVPLCIIHGDLANDLAKVINDQSIEAYNRLQVSSANEVRTLQFIPSADSIIRRRANVTLRSDDGETYRFHNINNNQHMYFLKINDNVCVVPATIGRQQFTRTCFTSGNQLRTNCIDGRIGGISMNNNLKNFYETYEAIRCNVISPGALQINIPIEFVQFIDEDGVETGQGPLRTANRNYAYVRLLDSDENNPEFRILINDDESIQASMVGNNYDFITAAEGSEVLVNNQPFWSFRTRLGEFEVIT